MTSVREKVTRLNLRKKKGSMIFLISELIHYNDN